MAIAAGWDFDAEPQPSNREEQAEANLDGYLDSVLGTFCDSGCCSVDHRALGRAFAQVFRRPRRR
jgi:hypothetical protein